MPTLPDNTYVSALRFHQLEDKLGQKHKGELSQLAFHLCF